MPLLLEGVPEGRKHPRAGASHRAWEPGLHKRDCGDRAGDVLKEAGGQGREQELGVHQGRGHGNRDPVHPLGPRHAEGPAGHHRGPAVGVRLIQERHDRHEEPEEVDERWGVLFPSL